MLRMRESRLQRLRHQQTARRFRGTASHPRNREIKTHKHQVYSLYDLSAMQRSVFRTSFSRERKGVQEMPRKDHVSSMPRRKVCVCVLRTALAPFQIRKDNGHPQVQGLYDVSAVQRSVSRTSLSQERKNASDAKSQLRVRCAT